MKYLFLLGCSFALAAPAWAQDAATEEEQADYPDIVPTRIVHDNEITVIATGWRQKVEESGQTVSVVGASELDEVQGLDLTRVLERLPGVSFSRNGGLGGQTGLNVRGANADQVLVLVDGVRIADYASPGGAYDLGNLLGGNLSKLELLRGSNSVIWGSQAIGGVLAVTSEALDGVRVTAEYGAYDTVLLTAGAGIGNYDHAFSLTTGYARSDGFSAQSGGSEADGYRQWNLAAKGRVELDRNFELKATGRYSDSRLAIDLLGPNSADFQDTREVSGRVGLTFDDDRNDRAMRFDLGLAYSDVRRDYETGFGPSSFTGRSWRAEIKGGLNIASELGLEFGADTDWTHSTSSFDPAASARQTSGHAQLTWRRRGFTGQAFALSGGVRFDDHSRFGSEVTFGANATYSLENGCCYDGWRLRASFGEGFKAPTLYQLFGSFVGNSLLQPETSRSYDIAIEKGDRNDRVHLAFSAFRRDSRNLIDLDSAFVYQNVARARAEGFELELGARLDQNFRAQAAYTWLKARNLTTGRDLARRPRHALSLNMDWTTPLAGLELGADLRLQGDSVEYNFAGTPIPLDGFVVATLRASVPLGENLEVYGRVENLGNVRYETAAGFNSPGRSAYAGVRVRF